MLLQEKKYWLMKVQLSGKTRLCYYEINWLIIKKNHSGLAAKLGEEEEFIIFKLILSIKSRFVKIKFLNYLFVKEN